MTFEIAFVLTVLVVALVFFVREWGPPDLVAIGLIIALVAGRILTPRDALRSFGNEALVTVGAMFVLSAALTRTGAVNFVGRRVLALGAGSEVRLLLSMMLAVALCSAFINNTPVAVIFLPIVLGLGEATGVRASKLLIPMSYATIVGGMSTVIGTSTNVLVSSMLPDLGMPRIAMFEPLPLALIGFVMTAVYMTTLGRRLLPNTTGVITSTRSPALLDYVTELVVAPGSPSIGKSLRDAVLAVQPEVRVLRVRRGRDALSADPRRLLAEGDVLVVKGEVNALLALRRSQRLRIAPELTLPGGEPRFKDVALAELLPVPASAALGERVRDLELGVHHGVQVLAVQRHGLHVRGKIGDLRLRFGDVLLVQVDAAGLPELKGSRDFVVVEGIADRVVLSHRASFALLVVALVVVVAVLQIEFLPISILAVAGAALMVVGRCLSMREAYRAIDLSILVLIGGTLALGQGMQDSGTAAWLATVLVGVVEPLGAVGVLSVIYLLANVLTALISNNAAAVLMLPIALSTAAQQGLDPRPFVMAVMFAASIDFSTPFGYQTNTFVYGPGGYRFADYVRVGGPLNLLWWGLATVAIPLLWPLRPSA